MNPRYLVLVPYAYLLAAVYRLGFQLAPGLMAAHMRRVRARFPLSPRN